MSDSQVEEFSMAPIYAIRIRRGLVAAAIAIAKDPDVYTIEFVQRV